MNKNNIYILKGDLQRFEFTKKFTKKYFLNNL